MYVKVGGVNANKNNKVDFIYENMTIQNNIIHSAYKNNVERLVFLGSSCIIRLILNNQLKKNIC